MCRSPLKRRSRWSAAFNRACGDLRYSPAWRSHSAREDGPPARQKVKVGALVRGVFTRHVMSHEFKLDAHSASALVVCCVTFGHFCPPHSAGPAGISDTARTPRWKSPSPHTAGPGRFPHPGARCACPHATFQRAPSTAEEQRHQERRREHRAEGHEDEGWEVQERELRERRIGAPQGDDQRQREVRARLTDGGHLPMIPRG